MKNLEERVTKLEMNLSLARVRVKRSRGAGVPGRAVGLGQRAKGGIKPGIHGKGGFKAAPSRTKKLTKIGRLTAGISTLIVK